MANEVKDQNVVYKGMEKRSTLPLQNPQITSAVHIHVSEMSFSVYANATHHACVFVCVCARLQNWTELDEVFCSERTAAKSLPTIFRICTQFLLVMILSSACICASIASAV